MTQVQVVFWREIPAQVKARQGRQRAGRALSARFQEAIDAAAMRAGLTGTDAYLAEWHAGDWADVEGSVEQATEAAAATLEAAYDDERLRRLAEAGGMEG
jgi:hypothetical protein